MNPSLGNTKIPFFSSQVFIYRNLQPLPVYFCCRPNSPGISLHLALFSQLQATTDCEGLLKCLSSGCVLPTRNFPSFSKTPGSFWADAIWYFPSDQVFIGHFLRDCLSLNLQGCGAKTRSPFTFPRYIVILELGGASLIFQFCLFVTGGRSHSILPLETKP